MVYDELREAGESHGIADYGSFAMNSLQMEKAFEGPGERTNEVTDLEAGVMRFVRSEPAHLGREEAFHRARRWTCAFREIIEPDRVEDGHRVEAVLRDGAVVGSTCSGANGHSAGSILAFAYVSPKLVAPGTALVVRIVGRPRVARVLGEAAYDPGSLSPSADGSAGAFR